MSFFLPFLYLVIFIRLKFHETTEAFKNPPIIPSPIFLFYSRRILNFEISKLDQKKKKKRCTKFSSSRPSFLLCLVISIFEIRTKYDEKNSTPRHNRRPHNFRNYSSLFSFFSFFFSQIGGRVGDNFKKNHRRFHPPPEVRVSFARDASLEAHIPSPQCSFWNLTSAKGA